MTKRMILLPLFLLPLTACGSNRDSPLAPSSPPPPSAPVVPSCQANSTALVTFENRSKATTHTVLWDGFTMATLAPGASSSKFTTAAGVAHRWEVMIANTTLRACAIGSPILTTCGDQILYCAFP